MTTGVVSEQVVEFHDLREVLSRLIQQGQQVIAVVPVDEEAGTYAVFSTRGERLPE